MLRHVLIASAVAAALAPAATSPATAQVPTERGPEIIRTGNFSMTLGSQLQVRFTHTAPDEGDSNGSVSIRRAQLSLGGSAYQHFRYAVKLEMAGGSVNLLDANITHSLAPIATFRAGQGKVHFGRQRLNSSGNLHFVDRSIVDARFSVGRQAGLSLSGQHEARAFEYAIGVYNGTGINAANDNGKYMISGRAVVTPLGEYSPAESAFDYPESPRVALGVAGLRTTTGSGMTETDITRWNVESAFKIKGFNATAEFYLEEAEPAGGESLTTTGWYVQPGFLFPNRRNELAARYAVVSPDTPLNSDTIELGVAFSHYFHQHRAKLQADLRNVERKATDASDLEFRVQLQLVL